MPLIVLEKLVLFMFFLRYLPSYPLICLAAQYSQRVYTKATGKEREAFVDSNWRMGTKAMVLKSVPIDDMNTIVFAIRGSQTFMDWAVNLKTAPVSPQGFLVCLQFRFPSYQANLMSLQCSWGPPNLRCRMTRATSVTQVFYM